MNPVPVLTIQRPQEENYFNTAITIPLAMSPPFYRMYFRTEPDPASVIFIVSSSRRSDPSNQELLISPAALSNSESEQFNPTQKYACAVSALHDFLYAFNTQKGKFIKGLDYTKMDLRKYSYTFSKLIGL